jgi:hypothetical protein
MDSLHFWPDGALNKNFSHMKPFLVERYKSKISFRANGNTFHIYKVT